MDIEIRAWANMTYALVQQNKIAGAIKYLWEEYNGSVMPKILKAIQEVDYES